MGEKRLRTKVVKITVERHVTLEQKTCRQCGRSFMGTKIARYCSTACRNKAAYWRRPDVYRQKRRESYRRVRGQTAERVKK